MIQFKEWLQNRDPELHEGWLKNAALSGAMALGLGGAGAGLYYNQSTPNKQAEEPVATQEAKPNKNIRQEDESDKILQAIQASGKSYITKGNVIYYIGKAPLRNNSDVANPQSKKMIDSQAKAASEEMAKMNGMNRAAKELNVNSLRSNNILKKWYSNNQVIVLMQSQMPQTSTNQSSPNVTEPSRPGNSDSNDMKRLPY